MSNNILFIFEGPDREKQIFESLNKFFFNEGKTIITCAYCTTIYPLYKEILKDEDLDTFNLLKSIDTNKEILKAYTAKDFAEIYMFFDYDGHATNASDEKLIELLNFFDEETEKGKLYLSYPMIESLKDIEDFNTFENLTVECKKDIRYKSIVGNRCLDNLKHFHLYDLNLWKTVITIHLKKMNKIVHNSFAFPKNITTQLDIFDSQKSKYIDIDQTVAVLNSFPTFIHDYYGNTKTQEMIS